MDLAGRARDGEGPAGAFRLGRHLPGSRRGRRLGGAHPHAAHGRSQGARRTARPGRTPARLRRPVLSGRTHALDDGTPLSALVLRALATLYDTVPPQSAAQRRALWTRAGVADDELSATVLVGGLRPAGDGLLARVVTACAEAGQAASLPLSHVRYPGEFILPEVPVPVVHVVENPSVLALALRRFGSCCPPLVCTSGWPNSAAIQLLRMLADHGAALRYHGDFDGEGVRLAAHVLDKAPARPWRMTAADYRAAVALNPRGPQRGRPKRPGIRTWPRPWRSTASPWSRNWWRKCC